MTAPVFFTTSILRKPAWVFHRGAKRGTTLPLRVRVGYFHHPALGHTLIDTGYSRHTVEPRRWLFRLYKPLLGPSILTPAPLADGLARIDLTPDQIDTVILTHLHPDHIGGLRDVPRARVLVARDGWQAYRASGAAKNAFSGVFSELLPDDIAARLEFVEDCPMAQAPGGLGQGFDLTGDGAVLVLDLPGHQRGHIGLCFPEAGLVYGADAQWLLDNLLNGPLPGVPLSLIQHDRRAAQKSVERLRAYVAGGGELMLCHDPGVTARDIDGEVR